MQYKTSDLIVAFSHQLGYYASVIPKVDFSSKLFPALLLHLLKILGISVYNCVLVSCRHW